MPGEIHGKRQEYRLDEFEPDMWGKGVDAMALVDVEWLDLGWLRALPRCAAAA
jgi:hypothetical protein